MGSRAHHRCQCYRSESHRKDPQKSGLVQIASRFIQAESRLQFPLGVQGLVFRDYQTLKRARVGVAAPETDNAPLQANQMWVSCRQFSNLGDSVILCLHFGTPAFSMKLKY